MCGFGLPHSPLRWVLLLCHINCIVIKLIKYLIHLLLCLMSLFESWMRLWVIANIFTHLVSVLLRFVRFIGITVQLSGRFLEIQSSWSLFYSIDMQDSWFGHDAALTHWSVDMGGPLGPFDRTISEIALHYIRPWLPKFEWDCTSIVGTGAGSKRFTIGSRILMNK